MMRALSEGKALRGGRIAGTPAREESGRVFYQPPLDASAPLECGSRHNTAVLTRCGNVDAHCPRNRPDAGKNSNRSSRAHMNIALMPRSPATRSAASSLTSHVPSRGGKAHTIRIIGGEWKRTPLPVLDLDGLRPTPDRVRETLFNWLGQDLSGQRCLDMFAGSGALGFEAASRGAARVLMIERSNKAAAQIRANQAKLGARNIEIAEADALRLAASLTPASFDVIFLDPPFGDSALLARALELAAPLATPDGAIYVECGEPLDVAQIEALAGWTVVRDGKAGAVRYHLLRRQNDE
jgi:16S rRNA (guanine966-N2)-methyltransferase